MLSHLDYITKVRALADVEVCHYKKKLTKHC